MGRIAADTNDLRSGASALRNTAGVYQDVAALVSSIVDPYALPTEMRAQIAMREAQMVGEARNLSGLVADESAALERGAAAFDGIDGGGGLGLHGMAGWGMMAVGAGLGGSTTDRVLDGLKTAIGWAQTPGKIVGHVEKTLKTSASVASRILRKGHGKLQSLAGRWLPKLGKARKAVSVVSKPLDKLAKKINPVSAIANGIDTYRRTPGSVRQKLASVAIGVAIPYVVTKNPLVAVVDSLSGNQIEGAGEFQTMNQEFNHALATGDDIGAQRIAQDMKRKMGSGDFGYIPELYVKFGGQ